MDPSNHFINQLLLPYKEVLDKDFEKYRNHVYRVYEFCQLLDPNSEQHNKYALAAVYHDLGIWLAETFDYIRPSVQEASNYLQQIGKEEWLEEVAIMIDMHHKRSPYEGSYQQTVETFRKADWIDLSKGMMRFGLDRQDVNKIIKDIPNLGFHWFLTVKSIKYFIQHPTNPLPMFRP